MTEKWKTSTAEFKHEAVRLSTAQGYGVAETARNLGLHVNMLRRWRRELNDTPQGALPGDGRLTPEPEELHRLREENTRLRMARDIVKKSDGLLCQRVELSYAFILPHRESWPMAVWCAVLAVSRSGVYASAQRHAPPRLDREEVVLLARVKARHAETGQSYGSRRRAKQRQAEGDAVGRDKARRLLRDAGVVVRRRTRRGPVTPDSQHGYAVAPHRLARQFDVDKPAQVWAGDMT
jgi:putative transposase